MNQDQFRKKRICKWGLFKQNVSRREFVKTQLKVALGLMVSSSGLSILPKAYAGQAPDISVVTGNPGPATRKAVDMVGGIKRFVQPKQKVVIKPNMSFAMGQINATNTDAAVVREVAMMCHEAGAQQVKILDHTLGVAKFCIPDISRACESVPNTIIHTISGEDAFETVKITDSWFGFNKTDIMSDVLAADVLIAVPKAKHHHMTDVSLSMKGMMGCNWDRMEMHYAGLDQAIVNLASYLKPDLVVVDATRVLSTNGPRGPGKVIPQNMVIASNDMVAADAMTVTLCEWGGGRMQPHQVSHIRLAHEEKLGRMDVENLNVKQAVI